MSNGIKDNENLKYGSEPLVDEKLENVSGGVKNASGMDKHLPGGEVASKKSGAAPVSNKFVPIK